MPVVINDFQVLPETPAETRQNPSETPGEGAQAEALDPSATATVLRVLDVRALRAWAH